MRPSGLFHMFIKCLKKTYDKKGAQSALNKIHKSLGKHKKRYKRSKEIRYYFCDQCNGWHLTSMSEDDRELFEVTINKELFKPFLV